jgi:hypothetical protein
MKIKKAKIIINEDINKSNAIKKKNWLEKEKEKIREHTPKNS